MLCTYFGERNEENPRGDDDRLLNVLEVELCDYEAKTDVMRLRRTIFKLSRLILAVLTSSIHCAVIGHFCFIVRRRYPRKHDAAQEEHPHCTKIHN